MGENFHQAGVYGDGKAIFTPKRKNNSKQIMS